MRDFKKLKKKLSYLNAEQIDKIYQAFLMASGAHAGQTRTSGDIYISHPLAVAGILAEMHMDADSIIAALLHDVIEDTPVIKEAIAKKFGKTVAGLVDGVTKLSRINFSTIAEAQAESFRKMILAMSQDIRVILVKLADRLHNMHTLHALPLHKRRRIARETLEIYAPIADRVGIHDICIELENLSFAALYPNRYRVISEAVKKSRGNRKAIVKIIEKDMKKHFAKHMIGKPIISGREKHIYSIYRKMKRRRMPFEEIMDLYGCRIVVDSVDNCYRALGLVHSLYKPVTGKFKDYIAIPKGNGYQSLHTTLFGPHALPIEIQIRTQEMDQFANKGIAAHWLYKSDEKIDKTHIKAQQWINDLLEMQQKTGNSLEFIENVKIDLFLFPKEIYVFTPRGGILELPRGSTVIDFAYAVHTDIGNTCAAAKVDYRFTPLSTVLINGQTVSIITSPVARPNPAWLNFAKTGKARSAIRHYLKKQHRFEVVNLGKELLSQALAVLNTSIEKLPQKAITGLLAAIGITSLAELYEEIGLGTRVATFVAHQLMSIVAKKRFIGVDEPKKPLLIKGTEGLAVSFASCCYPIPGDPVVGLFSAIRGLEIHTESCNKVLKFRQQEGKCMLASWAEEIKREFYVVVKITMFNKRGAFAKITKIISDLEISLDDITIYEKTPESYSLKLRLLVRNLEHLNKLLRAVASLPFVTSALRI